MPRGYDLDTAGTLSEEQRAIACGIVSRLKLYGRWITGTEIMRIYKTEGVSLTGPTVRAMVHHAVVVLREPIASGPKGYKYCTSKEELELTIAHHVDREQSIKEKRLALQELLHRHYQQTGLFG